MKIESSGSLQGTDGAGQTQMFSLGNRWPQFYATEFPGLGLGWGWGGELVGCLQDLSSGLQIPASFEVKKKFARSANTLRGGGKRISIGRVFECQSI